MLDTARASLAGRLGIRPSDLYLTSSGPVAAQICVQGMLAAGGTAVLGATETMAISEPVASQASDIRTIRADSLGRVDLEAWVEAVQAGVRLACLQAANPEVGTVQPLAGAAEACRAAGVPLLVHAVQVLGRVPVPEHWDVLVASARDFGGPAGVGLIAVRSGLGWRPDQSPDRGWVRGFPDIPGAAGAAAAWEYLEPHRASDARAAFTHVARLRHDLPEMVDGLLVVGDGVERLPHVLTVVIDGIVGEALVHELARRGISVASGSACTSDARMASAVLEAMGFADRSSLRISLPYNVDERDIDALMHELPEAVATLR